MRVCTDTSDGLEKLFGTSDSVFRVYLLDEVVL